MQGDVKMEQLIPSAIRNSWCVPTFDCRLWLGRSRSWCVVIPVINEGERIKALLGRMSALNIENSADIIVVDGGSTDDSLPIDELQAKGVRGLLIKTGLGKLSAQLRCAYAFALDCGYEGIVTIDGNNKDDPAAIPAFIDALKNGVDFVQASRYVSGGRAENTPKIRSLAIRWIHAPLLSFFSGHEWTDTTQGFRAYSRRMLLDTAISPFREIFMSYELLAYLNYRAPRLGYRCIELPTARCYPANGHIPTKIDGLRGSFAVFSILCRACLGQYDPKV